MCRRKAKNADSIFVAVLEDDSEERKWNRLL